MNDCLYAEKSVQHSLLNWLLIIIIIMMPDQCLLACLLLEYDKLLSLSLVSDDKEHNNYSQNAAENERQYQFFLSRLGLWV